jgi:hypothetical protein
VLTGKVSISNAVMEQKIREILAEFDARRKAYEADLADKQDVKEIEDTIKKQKNNVKSQNLVVCSKTTKLRAINLYTCSYKASFTDIS